MSKRSTSGFYMVHSTQTIMSEIEQGFTQKDVAVSYGLALRSAAAGTDTPEWSVINRAILARWSMSGLERIKKRAWQIAQDEPAS